MAKDNYFDNEEDIKTKKGLGDNIKPVFSSLLGKINEQKEADKKTNRESYDASAPSFPEDILNLINANPSEITADIEREAEMDLLAERRRIREEQRAAERKKKKKAERESAEDRHIVVRGGERRIPHESPEDVAGAIKAFSHKSGEKITSVAHTIKEGTIAVAAVIEEKERTSSRAKRALVVLLMLMVTAGIFTCFVATFMHRMNLENERISKFNTEAGKVCADYVKQYGVSSYENLYTTYKIKGYRLTGICFVRELDFDNDGISELMLAYNKNGVYYNEVWGFNDEDEFVALLSEKTAQSNSKAKDAYSILYRKNNKNYIGVFDGKNNKKIQLYQLKGDKFVKKFDCEYDSKTKAYAVDGKDDTTAFERIKYSVFTAEKAVAESEKAAKIIEGFSGTGDDFASITEKQSLNNAYFSIVQEYNKRYGVAKYAEDNGVAYIDGLAVVDLIDFDGDKTNELLLVYRKPIKVRNEAAEGYASYDVDTYYCEIYRYTGTKAVLAYTSEGLSNAADDGDDRYFVIKKEGKKSYYCTNSFSIGEYGRHINATSSMFKFDGLSFTSCYSASYETDYGYTEYIIDGEEVSKSTFDSEGYKVALFDGGEEYDTDSFRVVYVQRPEGSRSSISSVPSQTEKAIQKIYSSYSAD